MEKVHAHAGGIVGGYSVCGEKGGVVTDDDHRINCEACVRWIKEYLRGLNRPEDYIAKILGPANGLAP